MKKLVLITGTGRSGTSTMSGTLHHLGLYVPGPYLGANRSNPKGFFESKWAVRFHKEILATARVNDFDSRPAAFDRAQAAITAERHDELVQFLTEQCSDHDQIVVKDPRSVWAQGLWREAAAEAGLRICYISMLRHPAEVVGSRATYYASSADESARRSYETFSVARWINSSLISERETRGQSRAFVSYPDLISDWRPVLAQLGAALDLSFDVDVTSTEPSAVDDFIDPHLRRHQVTWEELDIPTELQDVAQRTWDGLEKLAAGTGHDEAASGELDVLYQRYARIFTQAADIAHDATEDAKAEARRGAHRARRRAKKGTPPKPRPATIDDLPVGQVGARDLLKVMGRRARSRLRG